MGAGMEDMAGAVEQAAGAVERAAAGTAGAVEQAAAGAVSAASKAERGASSATASKAADTTRDAELRSFMRAENEDDDGYDPWSDRPATREPLFERDPWA